MNASPDPSAIDRRLEQEHVAFRAAVREIQAELDRRRQSRDLAGCGETMLAQLDQFGARLKTHFEYEESGWARAEASADLPPATRRWIDALTCQHDDFRVRIERLVSALSSSLLTTSSLPATFEGDLSSLLADLTQHEFSEARLFQRSMFEELGGFD